MTLLTGAYKDNKGITLVELMVSISISVLVTASIAYLISYSSRNYKNASEEVSLQTEAQTIINQLSDLIMESNNVKYNSNILTINQAEDTYLIKFDNALHQLLFEKVPVGNSPTGTYMIFGRYVEDFQVVDTGASNTNNKIVVSLSLKSDSKTYSIQDNVVTIRNQIRP